MGKGKRGLNADFGERPPVKRKRTYKARDPTTMYTMNYGYTGIGPRCQRPYRRYTEEDLFRIADLIKKGELSVRKAARIYRMSEEVLRRGVEGLGLKQLGRQKALTNEEEKTLTLGVESCVQWGLTIHKRDLQFIIKSYLDAELRKNQLNNNMPKDDFLKAYMRRYRQLFDIVPRSRTKQIILTKSKVDTLNALMVLKQKNEDVVDPLSLFPFDITTPPKTLHKKHPNYMLSCWRNAFVQYFKDSIARYENAPKTPKPSVPIPAGKKEVQQPELEAKKRINRKDEYLLFDLIMNCRRRWLDIYKSEILWLVQNYLDVQNLIEKRMRVFQGPGIEWLEDYMERFDMIGLIPIEFDPDPSNVRTRMIEGSLRKIVDKVGLFPIEKNSFRWDELDENHLDYRKHCWKYVFLKFLSYKDIKIVFYEGSEFFKESTKQKIMKACNIAIANTESTPFTPPPVRPLELELSIQGADKKPKVESVPRPKKRRRMAHTRKDTASSMSNFKIANRLSLKNMKIVAKQLGQRQISLLKKNYNIDVNDLKLNPDVKVVPLSDPTAAPISVKLDAMEAIVSIKHDEDFDLDHSADEGSHHYECDTIIDDTTYECPDANNTVIEHCFRQHVIQNSDIEPSHLAENEILESDHSYLQNPEIDRIKELKSGEYVIVRVLKTDSSSYVAQVEQILKGLELDTIVVSILQPCNPGKTIFVLPDEEVRVMMQRSHVLRVIKDPVVRGDKLHFKRKQEQDKFFIQ